jgi:uncharacterized protein CbrC (UPF0167 family)
MSEQDWADRKADEVVGKILSKAIGLESWDKEDWSVMKLEIIKSLREARKIEWPDKTASYNSFIKEYSNFPSQDNEGYTPDRDGFKAGWFACLHWLTAHIEDKRK